MTSSPEFWYVIASIAATLIVQAAHARGLRLPLVEALLDWIARSPPPTAPTQAKSIQIAVPDGQTAIPEVVADANGKWHLRWRGEN